MAGMVLSTSPTSHLTRLQPHLFRAILLRRLRHPLLFSKRSCRCGRPFDSSGHHRAACAQAGVLGGEVSRSRARQPASVVRQSQSQRVRQRHGPHHAKRQRWQKIGGRC